MDAAASERVEVYVAKGVVEARPSSPASGIVDC